MYERAIELAHENALDWRAKGEVLYYLAATEEAQAVFERRYRAWPRRCRPGVIGATIPSGGTYKTAESPSSACLSSRSSGSSVLRSPPLPDVTGPGGLTSGPPPTSTPQRGWEPAGVRPTVDLKPAPWTSCDQRADDPSRPSRHGLAQPRS